MYSHFTSAILCVWSMGTLRGEQRPAETPSGHTIDIPVGECVIDPTAVLAVVFYVVAFACIMARLCWALTKTKLD